jgi:hypothetical protein
MPSREMLAAPSRKAVQTFGAGPGRSSAAMTSHKIRSAGAIAAVPMTEGREAKRFIRTANYRSKFGCDWRTPINERCSLSLS